MSKEAPAAAPAPVKFRSWHWYALFIVPLFVGYVACHVYGYSVGEWIFGITFAVTFGSILGTEVTFWQLRHRRGGIVKELIDELATSESGRKIIETLERISDFLKSGQFNEATKLLNEFSHWWAENREEVAQDAKTLLEFVHEFAQRYRKRTHQKA